MALPVASWVDQRNVGSTIDERFDQPNFKAHKNLESVLVNFLNDDDFSSQIKLIKEKYAEDIKYYYLLPQLEIFKVLMKGKQTNRKFFRYITLNKVKRQKSLAWACHDYCGCTNLQTSFSTSIQSLQQRAKDHFSFLWRADSKPVCALRWPSRDLRVVQS